MFFFLSGHLFVHSVWRQIRYKDMDGLDTAADDAAKVCRGREAGTYIYVDTDADTDGHKVNTGEGNGPDSETVMYVGQRRGRTPSASISAR